MKYNTNCTCNKNYKQIQTTGWQSTEHKLKSKISEIRITLSPFSVTS